MEGGLYNIVSNVRNYFVDFPFEYSVSITQLPLITQYGHLIGSFLFGPGLTLLYMTVKEKKRNLTELLISLLLIISGIGFILVNYPISSNFYNVRSTKNNIEIIRPYINEKEYQNFQSQFLQIKTQKEYNQLKVSIETIANDNKLSLQ